MISGRLYVQAGWAGSCLPCGNADQWQWQPTLTAHDPNPPITLELASVAFSYDATSSPGGLTFGGAVTALFNSITGGGARMMSRWYWYRNQ